MRLKGVLLLFTCLLLLSMSICQAQERKDEWKKPDFDFGKVKTILVNTSIDPKAQVDQFNIRKLENFYSKTLMQDKNRWSKNNFRFITLDQLKDKISNITGENIRQMEIDNVAQYKSEMDRFTLLMTDAVLNIKLTSFGYDQRFVPESSYTYTEEVETEIESNYQDSSGRWVHGKKTIKIPVTRVRTTPAHYDSYGNAGVEYTLINNKTNESIWMLLDIREANGKDPMDMTERIINRAAGSLSKL